jgi:pimeloyl-ACP methyl ester carboxylesterase
MAALIDYDPRPALERLEVPILAVFGAADPITPVEESVSVFREAVRPDLLQVEVLDGAGHRLEIGGPPAFVDGYFEVLASFMVRAGV